MGDKKHQLISVMKDMDLNEDEISLIAAVLLQALDRKTKELKESEVKIKEIG